MNTSSNPYETTADVWQTASETTADVSPTASKTSSYVWSTASEVVTDILNTTTNVSTTPTKEEQNLGLIIGLSVGIPCGVAVIIALALAIFYFYKKKTTLQIQNRQHDGSDSYYETTISRAQSNYYDDVAIPSRNEPVYDTTLRTHNSVYETTLNR